MIIQNEGSSPWKILTITNSLISLFLHKNQFHTPLPLSGKQRLCHSIFGNGILSLYFFCCAPFLFFILSSLGVLFFLPVKVRRARSGAESRSCALCHIGDCRCLFDFFLLCTSVLTGRKLFFKIIYILTDDNVSDEELYNFLDEYLNGFEGDAGTDSWD